jgi:radical SAM protein with 4Fe4S-binding SPASM domain
VSLLEGLVSEAKRKRIEANGALLFDDLSRQRTAFRARPLLLEFSSNNLCNLKCLMCRPNGKPAQVLPPELVKEVLVDQLMPDALVLLPSDGSEPFLGDIDTLAEGCLKHEVQMFIITNGTMMTKDKLEKIAPAIGRLHISVDGHTAEIYERIRVGGNFDQLVENIRMAAGVARREGFELLMSTVFSMELVDHVDDYIRFAAGLGADAVEFQRIRHATDEARELDPFALLSPDRIRAIQETALKAAEEEGIDVHIAFWPTVFGGFNRRKRRRFLHNLVEENLVHRMPDFCYMAASYFKVVADGRVQPCCAAGNELFLGNIKDQPVDAIWNGEAAQELRQGLFDQNPPPVCKRCPNYRRCYKSAESVHASR